MLTDRRIQQLSSQGIIPKASRGVYDLEGAVQGYINYLKDSGDGEGEKKKDLYYEKVRLTRARADIEGMEAEKLRGELIPAEDVAKTWGDMVGLMRNKILAIPARAAQRVRNAKNNSDAQSILKTLIHEALRELKETEVLDEPDDIRASGT